MGLADSVATAEANTVSVGRRGGVGYVCRAVLGCDLGQVVAVLLAVFAVAPLAYPGFFQSHSGLLPIYNLYDFERQGGGPGWWPAVGRAFDLFRGGGPLPYAVAEVFRGLGASGPQAVLASFGAAFLVAAWAMYHWTRRWLGPGAALLAAVLYTYLPYHLTAVYVRGDLGEAWALALWPVVLWAAGGVSAGGPANGIRRLKGEVGYKPTGRQGEPGSSGGEPAVGEASAGGPANGIRRLKGEVDYKPTGQSGEPGSSGGEPAVGEASVGGPANGIRRLKGEVGYKPTGQSGEPARSRLGLLAWSFQLQALWLLAFALLCTANLGVALLSLPFLVGYQWAVSGASFRRGAVLIGGAVVVTVGLAHGWATRYPAAVPFADHFPYLFQLLSPAWNAAGQATGWLNGLPLQVGLGPLGLGLLAVGLLTRGAQLPVVAAGEESRARRVLWYCLGMALAGGLLLLAPLRVVWEVTGLAYLVTYPWQVMGWIGLALAVLGGSVVALDRRLGSAIVRAGLVTFVILASYGYLVPRFFDFKIDFTPEAKQRHVYVMEPRPAPVAVLGDYEVALLDYRVEGPLRHGATVRVNVLWQALRPLACDYVVFVHVIDDADKIWGQRDVQPKDGQYPTSAWGEGEIVADRYEFQIGVDGPREGYRLAVGLYRPDTGERLAVGGDTRMILQDE